MEEKSLINVTIGLDFGSSFTKVCYRLQGDRVDKRGVVEFSKTVSEPQNVLLKSVVYISTDGRSMSFYRFGNYSPIQFIKSDLTEKYMDPEMGENIKELCSLFLAGTIGFSKRYIETNEARLLEGKEIVWILNVGIPVDQNEPQLEDVYQEVIKIAVLRSQVVLENITIPRKYWSKLYQISANKEQNEMLVLLTSELLAEVIDVFEDPEIDEGMSMIIDIGSATVDVAVVNLDRSSSYGFDLVDFVSAKVSLLGVDSLVKYIDRSEAPKLETDFKHALLSEKYFKQIFNILSDIDIDSVDLNFYGKSLLNKFRGIIADTCLKVKKTYMNSMLTRSNTMPIYLLGGGNIYYWYKKWPEDAYTARLKNCNLPKFDYKEINRTPQFPQISPNSYHRFRVASGLLKFETSLRVSGYPWHFVPEERKEKITNYNRYRLEEIQREKYGDY